MTLQTSAHIYMGVLSWQGIYAVPSSCFWGADQPRWSSLDYCLLTYDHLHAAITLQPSWSEQVYDSMMQLLRSINFILAGCVLLDTLLLQGWLAQSVERVFSHGSAV